LTPRAFQIIPAISICTYQSLLVSWNNYPAIAAVDNQKQLIGGPGILLVHKILFIELILIIATI